MFPLSSNMEWKELSVNPIRISSTKQIECEDGVTVLRALL